MMLKQKAKGKHKRSFKDKQVNCLDDWPKRNHVAVLYLFSSLFTDRLAQCAAETEEDGLEEISHVTPNNRTCNQM